MTAGWFGALREFDTGDALRAESGGIVQGLFFGGCIGAGVWAGVHRGLTAALLRGLGIALLVVFVAAKLLDLVSQHAVLVRHHGESCSGSLEADENQPLALLGMRKPQTRGSARAGA